MRVGVHYGAGDIKLDPVSRGYDYYGTVVNTAARVESVCHGGQIGATKAVYDALRGRAPDVEWTDLGPQPLRGLAEPVHIVQALPCGALAARAFPPLRLDRERAGDAAEESAASRAGSAGSGASRGTAADAVFVPEQHPLVHKGQVSAAELRLHYNVSLTTLSTLLQVPPLGPVPCLLPFARRGGGAYSEACSPPPPPTPGPWVAGVNKASLP